MVVKNYFAMLRNIRNILEAGVDEYHFEKLVMGLTDAHAIQNSLVLPFRFTTAIEAVQQASGVDTLKCRQVITALNRAVDLSLKNVPAFSGKTLIALDSSGSMEGKPLEIGALFAAVLYKANDALFMTFSNDARFVTFNPADSTLTLAEQMKRAGDGGGTNFHAIFEELSQPFDRIIILSDMQGWIGYDAPTATFKAYKRRTGANPHVFSFDLAGYGSLQFPQHQVYCLAGFSEKTLELLKMLEEDRYALVRRIEAVDL